MNSKSLSGAIATREESDDDGPRTTRCDGGGMSQLEEKNSHNSNSNSLEMECRTNNSTSQHEAKNFGSEWCGHKPKKERKKQLKLIFRLFTLAANSKIHEQLSSFEVFFSVFNSQLVLGVVSVGKRKSHLFVRVVGALSLFSLLFCNV